MRTLRISANLHAALLAHAEQTYPHECCGILLGSLGPSGWQVESALPAANARASAAHNRYTIAPPELVRAQREARRLGLDIAGFYHSHPDQSAQWSSTDLDQAHWPGCVYLIVAVAQGRATGMNSFLLSGSSAAGKRFEAVILELGELAPPLSGIQTLESGIQSQTETSGIALRIASSASQGR